jgi:hypothetical protein
MTNKKYIESTDNGYVVKDDNGMIIEEHDKQALWEYYIVGSDKKSLTRALDRVLGRIK